MSPMFQMIFYVFDIAFNIWFVPLFASLNPKTISLNNMITIWTSLAVIRIILLYNPEPLPAMVLADPWNTIIFGAVGLVLFGLRKLF